MKENTVKALILPRKMEDTYKGSKIALYFFYLLTLITSGRSLIHIFAADGGAQSIATIPLDSYSAQASQTVILLFAYWGISQLIIGIFYGIVAWRYKSLIPLMYIFIFFEYVMRLALSFVKPIVTVGTAPGAVGNYILIPLAFILFMMSMKVKGNDD